MDDQSSPNQSPQNEQPVQTNTATNSAPPPQEVVVSTDQPSSNVPPASTTAPVAPVMNSAPPQAVVSDHKGQGHRTFWFVLIAVIIIAGGIIAAMILTRPKTATVTVSVVVKKDIPVINIAAFSPLPHTYYPDVQNDAFQQDIQLQMYEALTKFENGTVLKPGLAVSWTNPNSTTWVFKLRPGVKFHTGKTMTSADVVASIQAGSKTQFGQPFTSTIQSVKALDPMTVQFTTNGPDPILANKLASLYIYDTTSGKANNPINGSGPYMLASDTTNDIKLTAVNNYYGGHVYTREVDYLGYTSFSDVPKTLLVPSKLQLIEPSGQTSSADITTLQKAGYSILNWPTYSVGQLVLNVEKKGSPLANIKVRQAMAMAIDRNAYIKASGDIGNTPANQTIAQGIPGYDPSIKPVPFDVATAKADIAAAGYPNGFTIKYTYYAPDTNTSQLLSTELAAIGVKLQLDPQSDQQTFFNIAAGGQTDMFEVAMQSSYADGSDILASYIDQPYYTNAALDKLNTAASQELNPSKRIPIMQQMSDLLANDQANIPLDQINSLTVALTPGYVVHQDTVATIVGSYFWQDYQK